MVLIVFKGIHELLRRFLPRGREGRDLANYYFFCIYSFSAAVGAIAANVLLGLTQEKCRASGIYLIQAKVKE